MFCEYVLWDSVMPFDLTYAISISMLPKPFRLADHPIHIYQVISYVIMLKLISSWVTCDRPNSVWKVLFYFYISEISFHWIDFENFCFILMLDIGIKYNALYRIHHFLFLFLLFRKYEILIHWIQLEFHHYCRTINQKTNIYTYYGLENTNLLISRPPYFNFTNMSKKIILANHLATKFYFLFNYRNKLSKC